MKTRSLFILTLIFSMNAHAETCSLYAMKGEPELRKNVMGLVLASKTLSETFFPVERLQDQAFAPYLNKFISGKFVIREKDLTIVKVEEMDLATPDPLRPERDSTRKFLKELECPQK